MKRSTVLSDSLSIRPVRADDYQDWRKLWDGYNAFYGRRGQTALPESVTASTWSRFQRNGDPVRALVAELNGTLVGLTHFLFHPSTSRASDVCYLQDLFTDPACRSRGVGRRLIDAVCEEAQRAGASRVYWQTQQSNQVARHLYDQMAQFGGFVVYTREL